MTDDRADDAPPVHGDVPPAVATARSRVIDAFEHTADVYGLNRSYGRLYGVLFFADEPVSLDELAARSGYAKSTVSDAMAAMGTLHLVHRRSLPGEGKRAFFEAERDFWTVVQGFLRREVQREIEIMTAALEDAEATLSAEEHPQAERDLAKVRDMERVYAYSQRLVDVLTGSSVERLRDIIERLRGH